MSILEYKGYHTKANVDIENGIIHGKIEGIRDLVDFESDDIKGFENEFHLAVDDYLEFCKEVGKEPEKEYKGSFNVRIDPGLHKKLAQCAMKKGITLNAAVEKAIDRYVNDGKMEEVELWNNAIKTTSTIVQNHVKNKTITNNDNIYNFDHYHEEVLYK